MVDALLLFKTVTHICGARRLSLRTTLHNNCAARSLVNDGIMVGIDYLRGKVRRRTGDSQGCRRGHVIIGA
jgi:hypothetical protein